MVVRCFESLAEHPRPSRAREVGIRSVEEGVDLRRLALGYPLEALDLTLS